MWKVPCTVSSTTVLYTGIHASLILQCIALVAAVPHVPARPWALGDSGSLALRTSTFAVHTYRSLKLTTVPFDLSEGTQKVLLDLDVLAPVNSSSPSQPNTTATTTSAISEASPDDFSTDSLIESAISSGLHAVEANVATADTPRRLMLAAAARSKVRPAANPQLGPDENRPAFSMNNPIDDAA